MRLNQRHTMGTAATAVVPPVCALCMAYAHDTLDVWLQAAAVRAVTATDGHRGPDGLSDAPRGQRSSGPSGLLTSVMPFMRACVAYSGQIVKSEADWVLFDTYVASCETAIPFFGFDGTLEAFYKQHGYLRASLATAYGHTRGPNDSVKRLLEHYGYMMFKAIPRLHRDHTRGLSGAPPDVCDSPASTLFKSQLFDSGADATVVPCGAAAASATGPQGARETNSDDGLDGSPSEGHSRDDSDSD